MKKKENGITLIALVITIIILLILAGVTINWIMGDNSLFDRVELATQETKRAEIIEYLDLTLTDEQITGYKNTVGAIITKTHEKVSENGKNDLKDIAKEVEVMNLETKQINENEQEYYFFVVADGDIYRVGANGAKYIGRKSNEQIELQEGEIKFVYSDTNLTNKDVIVKIDTTNQLEGAKIVYRINYNGVASNEDWQDYNKEKKITVDKNCSIDAKITGITGETTTATGEVKNIDKLAPKEITQTSSKTTNSITITAHTEDHEKTDEYAMSGEVSYSFSQDGTTWSVYQTSGEYKFENLIQSTQYTIQIKAKDKVGNETETPVKVELTTDAMIGYVPAGNGQVANITFDIPSSWTKEKVTVTASTTTEYDIQTSTDKTTWYDTPSQTLSVNGDVYARLVDSTKQFAENSFATANVTCIDKTNPQNANITITSGNSITGGSNITANVELIDNESGVDKDKCRWVCNTTPGNNISEELFSNQLSETEPNITYTTDENGGEYYIHILTVDNVGNKSQNCSELIHVREYLKIDKNSISATTDTNWHGNVFETKWDSFTVTLKKGWKVEVDARTSYVNLDESRGWAFVKFNDEILWEMIDIYDETGKSRHYHPSSKLIECGVNGEYEFGICAERGGTASLTLVKVIDENGEIIFQN